MGSPIRSWCSAPPALRSPARRRQDCRRRKVRWPHGPATPGWSRRPAEPKASATNHMWTAPACKGFRFDYDAPVGCGHMSGPLSRRKWPLALMKFAERVPIKISRCECASIFSDLPILRLDRSSSPPRHPRVPLRAFGAIKPPPARDFPSRGRRCPAASPPHTMRAVRLASATATTFAGFRASIPRTHSASLVVRFRA